MEDDKQCDPVHRVRLALGAMRTAANESVLEIASPAERTVVAGIPRARHRQLARRSWQARHVVCAAVECGLERHLQCARACIRRGGAPETVPNGERTAGALDSNERARGARVVERAVGANRAAQAAAARRVRERRTVARGAVSGARRGERRRGTANADVRAAVSGEFLLRPHWAPRAVHAIRVPDRALESSTDRGASGGGLALRVQSV